MANATTYFSTKLPPTVGSWNCRSTPRISVHTWSTAVAVPTKLEHQWASKSYFIKLKLINLFHTWPVENAFSFRKGSRHLSRSVATPEFQHFFLLLLLLFSHFRTLTKQSPPGLGERWLEVHVWCNNSTNKKKIRLSSILVVPRVVVVVVGQVISEWTRGTGEVIKSQTAQRTPASDLWNGVVDRVTNKRDKSDWKTSFLARGCLKKRQSVWSVTLGAHLSGNWGMTRRWSWFLLYLFG